MNSRQLTAGDAHDYQLLRLRALREHPEAFGTSLEEEQSLPLEQVASQLDDPMGKSAAFGTWLDDRLVAIVSLFRFPRPKTRHKAILGGMYVAPEARGKGIGKALLEQTLIYARTLDGLEDVTLAVTVGNTAARQLYLNAGFVPYGVEPRYIKLGNQYFDIEWMILHLTS
ncbi:MAG TPA: GNAT family N-acetyltransferase [Herpetosiphonaceae bacterium]